MKEIKAIDENTIYVNLNGRKFLLSWKIDDQGYVAYCQGHDFYNDHWTEMGDNWRERAFSCLPASVRRAFDFVRFV